MKIKGYLFAILSAAAYGTNPIFAKPLYNDGMNTDSVLVFRYIFAVIVLALMMCYNASRNGKWKETFKVGRHNLPQLILLAFMMAMSSLTLFMSYHYIPVGIASTLLFVYPIMTALIMTLCYGEKLSWLVVLCLAIACSGVVLLCPMEEGSITLSGQFLIGFLIAIMSGLAYAIYLVGLNKTRLRTVASMPVTLYVLIFGTLLFVFRLIWFAPLTLPEHPIMWLNLLALGIFPTVISLVCTAKAIQSIGSTQTALCGAVEPVTAVILGVIILGEAVSFRDILGMILILVAVLLVVGKRK